MADDIVSRNRIAAASEMHIHVVNTMDRDCALRPYIRPVRVFLDLSKDFLIGQVRCMVFFIQLLQLVGDLSFLETAVTDRGHDRVPFAEAVFAQHR